MLSIINELERIGDVLFQMSKNLEKKIESKTWFTPEQRNMLIHMFELIDKAFTIMNGNLDKDYNKINMDEANDLEKEIRGFSDQIRVEHLKSIENGDYNIRSGLIYTELFTACEKLRDHIHNINESIYGKV